MRLHRKLFRPSLLSVLAVALAAPALPAAAEDMARTTPAAKAFAPAVAHGAVRAPGVTGRVVGEIAPLSAARVYVYQLSDFALKRATTDGDGRFFFPDLPAGLFKVIAHKSGFVPAVVMLTRTRLDAPQFLELQLAEERTGDVRQGEDFWSIRDQIPADVLREIEGLESAILLADSPFATGRGVSTAGLQFSTEMEAMTGVEQLPNSGGEALVAGGQVGLEGSMGGMRVGISGDYWRLGPGEAYSDTNAANMRQIAVELEGKNADIVLSTLNHRLVGSEDQPIDFETHRLSWNQDLGNSRRAHFASQYTSQANYYRQSLISPLEIPSDSTSWEAEASYTIDATERASFQGGFRYRDRSVGVAAAEAFQDLAPMLQEERLDLYGRAGTRITPSVLVEYGLYTTLRDGSLSLIPHGGLVFQLADHWQATTLVSQKVSTDHREGPRDFVPAFYHESSACTQGEQSCYKVTVSKRDDEGEAGFTVGAVHREIGETLRLFFNEDFFSQLESLYLVRGDRIPEIQLGFSRRLAPQLLARLESNVGQGGGGIFYATDRERYENSVRYLVASIDTQYQGTATGLFVSFHHLEQQLDPLREIATKTATLGGETDSQTMEVQRLQVMLTQDLNILLDLAADWALKLNMDFTRGASLYGTDSLDDDSLRRRVLGGFAVRF